MADELRTDTPGLALRVGLFEVEDVYVYLVYDPRLRFYIPKRWWVSERFDINVRTGPHIEVDVGRGQIAIYRPTHRIQRSSLALLVECLAFARDVLIDV